MLIWAYLELHLIVLSNQLSFGVTKARGVFAVFVKSFLCCKLSTVMVVRLVGSFDFDDDLTYVIT